MVTGNGTSSSWDHQSLPCWLYTVVSRQTLPQLPTAPAASTCCPCAGTGWQRQRACNCPSPPLWPQGSVRSHKKLSCFKLCFHWSQRQGQLCSEDGEGFSQPELLEGEENREGQGQNLLQFNVQCRRDHQGVPGMQETA